LKIKTITEIGEDELFDMGVMVYTLKMMKADKDPADIPGEPNYLDANDF